MPSCSQYPFFSAEGVVRLDVLEILYRPDQDFLEFSYSLKTSAAGISLNYFVCVINKCFFLNYNLPTIYNGEMTRQNRKNDECYLGSTSPMSVAAESNSSVQHLCCFQCVISPLRVVDVTAVFRSTSKSRPNNIRGGKMSVRPYVRPQKVSSI